jgi:hypothetical protein
MISTLTISPTAAQASSVALIVVMFLLVLLFQKELTTSNENVYWKKWGLRLNLAIAPLLISFGLIILFRLIQTLE